ncbi:MAG: helix-turn-helix domain-containing protein [Planctomycetota bacterium]
MATVDRHDPTSRPEPRLEALGARLAARRASLGLTQERLADEAGVSTSTVKRLERGDSVQLANLVRVLRALRSDADLDRIAPEPPVRPLDEVHGGRGARRGDAWVWGDERDGGGDA